MSASGVNSKHSDLSQICNLDTLIIKKENIFVSLQNLTTVGDNRASRFTHLFQLFPPNLQHHAAYQKIFICGLVNTPYFH